MAIMEFPKREATAPTTPRKNLASLLCLSRTASSVSSVSKHLVPPPSPRTFSESMMVENIENSETIIRKWDVNGPRGGRFTSLFDDSTRKEAKDFIKCVYDLRRAMHYLVSENLSSTELVLAQGLMQVAMKRLELEFYKLLTAEKEHLKPQSLSSQLLLQSRSNSTNSEGESDTATDDEIQMAEGERLTARALSDLRLISYCMIRTGYSRECVSIYIIIRKSVISETLYHLGIEHYSSARVNKMTLNDLERQIKNWLIAAKFAVQALHGERLFCDHLFCTASQRIREVCFADIIREETINLFKFPELIAKSRRSPDKIFRIMDLYVAMQDLWPDIESILSYESVSAIKLQYLSSLHCLGDSVKLILSEFERSIQKDSSRKPVSGGGVHPLTDSVLHYASSLANYSNVLSEIVADPVAPGKLPFPESYFDGPNSAESPTSAVSIRLAWIILVLLCKLDSKADLYNDIGLSYLFLVNNLQFIKEKVITTTLNYLLGDDWLARLNRKVRLYAEKYEVMTWGKVLACLPENLAAEMSRDKVKAHFRKFNVAFEEAYQKQMSWLVPNGKLRNEIKASIARKLLPVYRVFYDTNLATLSGENDFDILVRFSPDDLGDYLSDLFHGVTG